MDLYVSLPTNKISTQTCAVACLVSVNLITKEKHHIDGFPLWRDTRWLTSFNINDVKMGNVTAALQSQIFCLVKQYC